MNETRATPVTPYVSKPSAVGPIESPALSPVQSAITPGFLGSSSLMPNWIFIKSEPISAILVKIPPATRRAEAPSDSPIAKPIKQAPAISPGTNNKIVSININSTDTKQTPIDIPAFNGMFKTFNGFPFKEANEVLALARVFILTPNQATANDPKIPITDQARIINTFLTGIP